MAEASYQPKTYRKQGGDEHVIADGGQLTVEDGGEVEVESGGAVVVESGGTLQLDSGAVLAGIPPEFVGKTVVDTAVDLTLTAADHSGGLILVTKDAGADTKITLPTGVVGMDFVIMNGEADAGVLLQVDLDGNEIIEGVNLTIAATKLANLTKATSIKYDFIHLVCNVAATSWRCVAKRGTWVTSA